MSQEILCSFCESLPAARPGWGSQPRKCPLCKHDLWAAQDGTTYRVDASAAPAGSKWRWAAALTLAVGVGVAVWAARSTLTPPDHSEPPVKAAAAPVANHHAAQPMEAATGPSAQAKVGRQPYTVRVKPAAPPAGKQLPPVEPKVAVAAVKVGAPPEDKPDWRSKYVLSVTSLESQLKRVPEIDLDPDYMKRSKKEIAEHAQKASDANKKKKDAFVRQLVKDRDDLAGLPFLMGDDCVLPSEKSRALAAGSLGIRGLLAEAVSMPRTRSQGRSESGSEPADSYDSVSARFWSRFNEPRPEVVPAMHQILQVESKTFRVNLVAYYGQIVDGKGTASRGKAQESSRPVAAALLNRAIFDLDPDVRRLALASLRNGNKADYRSVLKQALRYPWQPVVRNAVEAIVTLDLKEMVPDLLAALDEPQPGLPTVVKGEDGKERVVVQEVVRINHHRNCMLCHAAVTPKEAIAITRETPVGPVPTPDAPLPPNSSPVYYSPRSSSTLVRADVTYLRQDFSLLQEVDIPGKWSETQRYDFLVRTREVTGHNIEKRPVAGGPYHETIAEALSALTGKDAAPTARAWREALAQPQSRVEPKVKPMPE
jgi:hypothetical protein